MSAQRILPLVSVLVGAPLVLAGCGGEGEAPTDAGPAIAQVEVVPAVDTLTFVGAALQLTAVARDARGEPIDDVSFAWRSSAPAVVTVDDSGLATAVGDGVGTVTASAGGASGQAVLRVDRSLPDPLAPEEARALADMIASSVLGALDGGLHGAQVQASAIQDGAAAGEVEIDIEFDVTRSCPIDGNAQVVGSLNGLIDTETRSGQLQFEAVTTLEGCQFEKDGTTFTVDTDPDVTVTADVVIEDGEPSVTVRVVGVIVWETDDGRSARCEIDLTITRTADGDETIIGVICEQEVGSAGEQ